MNLLKQLRYPLKQASINEDLREIDFIRRQERVRIVSDKILRVLPVFYMTLFSM